MFSLGVKKTTTKKKTKGVIISECFVIVFDRWGQGEETPHKRGKRKELERVSYFPNLWCRGGRSDAEAAMFVSAEHKLP